MFRRKRFALHARVAHATYTLHTRTSYYITHARAHIFLLFYFYFFSLTHSYLIRLYIAPREKERDIFFSLSRVRSPLSFSVSRVSAKAVHAKARASYCSHALLFDTNECFVFSRSLSFYVFFFLLWLKNGRRRVLPEPEHVHIISLLPLFIVKPKLP